MSTVQTMSSPCSWRFGAVDYWQFFFNPNCVIVVAPGWFIVYTQLSIQHFYLRRTKCWTITGLGVLPAKISREFYFNIVSIYFEVFLRDHSHLSSLSQVYKEYRYCKPGILFSIYVSEPSREKAFFSARQLQGNVITDLNIIGKYFIIKPKVDCNTNTIHTLNAW
jgi:hypothetical protein